MAPSRRDHIPIEDATVWDVVEWDILTQLSSEAPPSREWLTKENALSWFARDLVNVGQQADSDDKSKHELLALARRFVGSGPASERRRKASLLAGHLGADPVRFIELLTKWGFF